MCGETRIPKDMCAGNTLPEETHITVTPAQSCFLKKKQTKRYEVSNSNCLTTQGMRSQLFLIVFRYGWVHSLSMLLVWKRSETSHYLGDERKDFLQHQRIVSRFLAISSTSAATTITNYKLKLWQKMSLNVW